MSSGSNDVVDATPDAPSTKTRSVNSALISDMFCMRLEFAKRLTFASLDMKVASASSERAASSARSMMVKESTSLCMFSSSLPCPLW